MTPSHPTPTPASWRWIGLSSQAVLLVVVVLQWRSISQLRHDLQTLRAPAKAVPSKSEKAPAPPLSTAVVDRESWQELRNELQQLRAEIKQRKPASSPAKAKVSHADSPIAPQPEATAASDAEHVRNLIAAAKRGDASALDSIATRVGAGLAKPHEAGADPFAEVREAFAALGTEAGQGDDSALQTIWRASRIPELEGFATAALGQAAALGQEEALRPLLEPEAFFLLRASATSALKPVADAGNERAIQALAATAADPAQQPLWLLAVHGLQGAASAGNASAIDSLARLAAQASAGIQKEAVLALEAAARKNHPQAEEALRRLGWR